MIQRGFRAGTPILIRWFFSGPVENVMPGLEITGSGGAGSCKKDAFLWETIVKCEG